MILLFLFRFESINKPGGCAKIIKVHTNRVSDNLADDEDSYIEGLDVKYTVGGGGENNLDPAIVSPYEELQRGGRSRRGRDFLMQGTNANSTTKPTTGGRRRGKENVNEATTNKASAKTKKAKTPDLANKKQVQIKKNQPLSSQKSGATCSTPPPPPPKQVTKKQPKKVTPVPKVVLVNRSMKAANDVSPMWMDVTSCSNNHKNNNSIRKAQHRLDFDRDIPSLPNALLPPNKSMQSKSKYHKSINETKKRKRPPTAPTHDSTLSKNKQGNRPTASTINFSNSKPKTQTNNSFSRATSAYGSLPQSKSAKKKNLLDVYRSEVEKAHQFMDEMVGPRATDKAKLSETPQKS